MPELNGFTVLVVAWCILLVAAISIGVWRARRFECALRSAGFVRSDPTAYPADVFGRPKAIVSRVVTGRIAGTRTIFLFGSCDGHPVALEGIFDIPRLPVAAALLEPTHPRVWIETWTTDRANHLGWRPAHTAKVTADGRILLVWEGFSQCAVSFKRCCVALARTSRDS